MNHMQPLLSSSLWIHCLPEPVLVFDPIDGHILYANEIAAQLFECSLAELIEKKVLELDAHLRNLLAWQAQAEIIKHNGHTKMTSIYRKQDGTTIPVEVTSMYCYDTVECIVSIIHDISEYTEKTEKITISLQEKEHLLKEIHHRVKNNLQTISSLLSLGSKKISDESLIQVLKDSQNRIHAIALVHEILYKSDIAGRVDMSKYLKYLVDTLIDSFGSLAADIIIEMKNEKLFCLMDTAMPCGLILNELISNSIQHAFTESLTEKKVKITLACEENGFIVLTVADNGIGFDQKNIEENMTVGLKLVSILTKQLNGVLNVKRENGMTFQIKFTAPQLLKVDNK